MKNLVLLCSLSVLLFSCSLPVPIMDDFEGKMIYKIEDDFPTGNLDSTEYQIVYAKDSMLRIDTYTPLGKQKYIKHIPKNRAYILLRAEGRKFAIQTIPDTLENERYTYAFEKGKKEIAGVEAPNIKVNDKLLDTTLIMNYHPSISAKYSTAYEDFPGLPVFYYVATPDRLIQYKLLSIEEQKISAETFEIPLHYELITLDDFMELIQGNE